MRGEVFIQIAGGWTMLAPEQDLTVYIVVYVFSNTRL